MRGVSGKVRTMSMRIVSLLRFLPLGVIVALLHSPPAAAQTWSGPRSIVQYGCHTNVDYCWVQVSGAAVGPAACTGNELRWHGGTPGGKNTVAMIIAAHARGGTVDFGVVTAGCFDSQPTYPTFDWAAYR